VIIKTAGAVKMNERPLEWLWAKGHREGMENPKTAAFREFTEESGIDALPEDVEVCDTCVSYQYKIGSGVTYRTTCWIVQFKQEVQLTKPSCDNIEVIDRCWMTTEQVIGLLNNEKLQAFNEARLLIDPDVRL
jgi:8-oxo-dGTP pyrophosphatase MutT (NUDIX family)